MVNHPSLLFCFFGSFKEETAHLWETMVQVMVWLSHLADLSLIDLDSIENLAEFCGALLGTSREQARNERLCTYLVGGISHVADASQWHTAHRNDFGT